MKNLLLIFFIILSLAVLSVGINKPFVGQHDFMGATEGMMAKNYLAYGPITLKFGQVDSFITDVNKITSYHLSYPPLFPLLIALSYKIFGVSEWATRLVSVVFSMIAVLFFFKIVEKVWDTKTACLGCIFFIFNPMFIYYGKLPTPEPAIISCSLAVFYYYLKWLDKKDFKNIIRLLVWTLTGGLIAWQMIYICGVIVLHALILGEFSAVLLLPGLTVILTVIFLLVHSFILTGNFLPQFLIETLKFRLTDSNVSFGGLDFSIKNYVRQEVSWIQTYFTRTLVVLSGIYLISTLRNKLDLKRLTALSFLLFGLAHLVIFSRYVFIHDFMNIFLLPFLALSGALAVEIVAGFLAKKAIPGQFILIGVLLVLIFFVTERLSYTKALLNTDMNKQGQEMAMLLNKLQTDNNQAVIASHRFDDFYGVFTTYYSKYSYTMTTDQALKANDAYKKYKYIIMFDEDITDRNFYETLTKNYQTQRTGEMTIINTNE